MKYVLHISDKDRSQLFFDSKYRNGKTKLTELAFIPYVKVKVNSTRQLIHRDSIFGFEGIDGYFYRFYHASKLLVLNKEDSLVLYSCYNLILGEKNNKRLEEYYFSRGLFSKIYKLNFQELRKVFQGNKNFIEELNIDFRNEKEFTDFDGGIGRYRLPYFYELKLKTP